MTAQPVNPTPEPAQEPFYRTAGGQRLHIAPCPYILGADVAPASPADVLALSVCDWCGKELAGVGRRYFESLGDAMRHFGTHAGTEGLIREALQFVQWDQIWVPNSASYIALGREGQGVAWVGKTYVVPHAGAFVELPGYAPGAGGGVERNERVGEPCEVHFITMSLDGRCDDCD